MGGLPVGASLVAVEEFLHEPVAPELRPLAGHCKGNRRYSYDRRKENEHREDLHTPEPIPPGFP
jgi:hypothetical protein